MSFGNSASAKEARARRARLHGRTNGRCYYCGFPVRLLDERPRRDWLLMTAHDVMVTEHMIPLSRGGGDGADNTAPSCWKCNQAKGALTADEYRLLCGLRAGDLSFAFAFDLARPQRDWLCVHSSEFERSLIRVNYPEAA